MWYCMWRHKNNLFYLKWGGGSETAKKKSRRAHARGEDATPLRKRQKKIAPRARARREYKLSLKTARIQTLSENGKKKTRRAHARGDDSKLSLKMATKKSRRADARGDDSSSLWKRQQKKSRRARGHTETPSPAVLLLRIRYALIGPCEKPAIAPNAFILWGVEVTCVVNARKMILALS